MAGVVLARASEGIKVDPFTQAHQLSNHSFVASDQTILALLDGRPYAAFHSKPLYYASAFVMAATYVAYIYS